MNPLENVYVLDHRSVLLNVTPDGLVAPQNRFNLKTIRFANVKVELVGRCIPARSIFIVHIEKEESVELALAVNDVTVVAVSTDGVQIDPTILANNTLLLGLTERGEFADRDETRRDDGGFIPWLVNVIRGSSDAIRRGVEDGNRFPLPSELRHLFGFGSSEELITWFVMLHGAEMLGRAAGFTRFSGDVDSVQIPPSELKKRISQVKNRKWWLDPFGDRAEAAIQSLESAIQSSLGDAQNAANDFLGWIETNADQRVDDAEWFEWVSACRIVVEERLKQ